MTELELRRAPAKPVGREVFQEIDAMVRVRDLLWCEHAQNSHFIDLMVCRRIPQAVMHCVDILIRNGFSPSAVKTELKKDSYQRLLKIGSCTGQELRRKIYRSNFPLHKYTLDQIPICKRFCCLILSWKATAETLFRIHILFSPCFWYP